MSKQFLFGIIIFLVIPLHSMNSSQPLSCGLQNMVRKEIQPLLSLQEIARFKRSCKSWNVLGDVERFCPLSHKLECSTYACACLIKNYYTCGKALAHFARKVKKNAQNEQERKKDENMFKHLWMHHAIARDEDVAIKSKKPVIGLQNQVKVYREYSDEKKLRKHILESIARGICVDNNIEIVKTVLLGNNFDIFDLLSIKSAESCKFYYDLGYLFFRACQLNNAEVISLLCGGTINDRSFEYVMKYAQVNLLTDLIFDEILPVDVADENNKSVLHYLAERGYASAIEVVLDREACVNCVDKSGNTPLHYAVQNEQLAAVQKILSYENVDVHCKNKKGKKPIDYIPMLQWNLFLKLERLRNFTAIKEALQSYYQTA